MGRTACLALGGQDGDGRSGSHLEEVDDLVVVLWLWLFKMLISRLNYFECGSS